MYKLIEIETNQNQPFTGHTQYTIELVNFNADNSNTVTCKVYYNVTENQLTLKTSFKGTFKTVKKVLNNYIRNELIGKITSITEY